MCACARDRYRYSHIVKTLRALQSSVKTSLRIDDEGLLSLQFMMPLPRRGGDKVSPAFIQFEVGSLSLRERMGGLTSR